MSPSCSRETRNLTSQARRLRRAIVWSTSSVIPSESLARLEAFRSMPLEQFLADQDARDIACYRLLLSVEAALALCSHTTSRRLRQTPEDNAACFDALHTAGIIDAALSERLRLMARFRNLRVFTCAGQTVTSRADWDGSGT